MTQALESHAPFDRSAFTARSAMRFAWLAWLVLLAAPFGVFLWVVWSDTNQSDGAIGAIHESGHAWFLAAMLYLIVAVPLSFFARSRLFKEYWTGKTVPPRKYLAGMLIMWITMEIGGLFSLAGCLVSHQLLPNMVPALVAFLFFATQWPNGKAMTHTTGNEEDAALYEEPR